MYEDNCETYLIATLPREKGVFFLIMPSTQHIGVQSSMSCYDYCLLSLWLQLATLVVMLI